MKHMDELHKKQNEVAAALCHTMTQHYMLAQNCFPEAGQKTTLAMSVGMVGVSAMAALLTKKAINNKYVPTVDHIQFACMFLANSASFTEDGGLLVEFDLANVVKTLDQFKEMTGRSFEPELNKQLLEMIQDQRNLADKAFSGEMEKFRPH